MRAGNGHQRGDGDRATDGAAMGLDVRRLECRGPPAIAMAAICRSGRDLDHCGGARRRWPARAFSRFQFSGLAVAHIPDDAGRRRGPLPALGDRAVAAGAGLRMAGGAFDRRRRAAGGDVVGAHRRDDLDARAPHANRVRRRLGFRYSGADLERRPDRDGDRCRASDVSAAGGDHRSRRHRHVRNVASKASTIDPGGVGRRSRRGVRVPDRRAEPRLPRLRANLARHHQKAAVECSCAQQLRQRAALARPLR